MDFDDAPANRRQIRNEIKRIYIHRRIEKDVLDVRSRLYGGVEYISVDGVNKMNTTRTSNYKEFANFLLYKENEEDTKKEDTVESLIDDYKKYIMSQEEPNKQ